MVHSSSENDTAVFYRVLLYLLRTARHAIIIKYKISAKKIAGNMNMLPAILLLVLYITHVLIMIVSYVVGNKGALF